MATKHQFEAAGVYRWENIPEDPLMSHISVHVYCAYRMVFGPEWTRSFVRNHYDRLYYVESGEAVVSTAEQEWVLRPGRCYLIANSVLHRHNCPSQVVLHWCHFQTLLDGFWDLFQEVSVPLEATPEDPDSYLARFTQLEAAMQRRDAAGYAQRAARLLELMLPHLSRVGSEARRKADGRRPFLPVLNYIDEHLDQSIRIPELSRLLGLNPEYFSRQFRRHFHQSPKKYLLLKRIQRAQKLLCYSDLTVQEIGARCGMEDPFHFTKTFKRIAGLPPTEYRQRYGQSVNG